MPIFWLCKSCLCSHWNVNLYVQQQHVLLGVIHSSCGFLGALKSCLMDLKCSQSECHFKMGLTSLNDLPQPLFFFFFFLWHYVSFPSFFIKVNILSVSKSGIYVGEDSGSATTRSHWPCWQHGWQQGLWMISGDFFLGFEKILCCCPFFLKTSLKFETESPVAQSNWITLKKKKKKKNALINPSKLGNWQWNSKESKNIKLFIIWRFLIT